jgi:hypothetical protein
MSAAFALDYSPQELNERAAAQVTSYGVGTRSYNRSAEKREMDRQRKSATEKHEAAPKKEIEVPLICNCPQRPWPHEVFIHNKMRSEFWNRRFEWPWSLCLSTEKEAP